MIVRVAVKGIVISINEDWIEFDDDLHTPLKYGWKHIRNILKKRESEKT